MVNVNCQCFQFSLQFCVIRVNYICIKPRLLTFISNNGFIQCLDPFEPCLRSGFDLGLTFWRHLQCCSTIKLYKPEYLRCNIFLNFFLKDPGFTIYTIIRLCNCTISKGIIQHVLLSTVQTQNCFAHVCLQNLANLWH